MTQHLEDLPWNDEPADNDVVPGSEEPDPAEVVGTEDDPARRDTSLPGRLDIGVDHIDTLDERLAEEVQDRTVREQDPEAGELQAPESGEDGFDASLGEDDQGGPLEDRDAPAEEAAIHVVSDDRDL